MRILVGLFLLILFTPLPASADDYVMVFGGRYPPFYWMGKVNGKEHKGRGMFIDFLNDFLKANPEVDIKKVTLPRKRMDQWLMNGKANIFSLNSEIFIPPSQRSQVALTLPLWKTSDYLVVTKDSPIKDSSIKSMLGKRIGIIHGNKYGQLDPLIADKHIKAYPATSMRMLLDMLMHGRVDGVIANKHTLPHYTSLLNLPRNSLTLLEPPVLTFDLSIVIRKENTHILTKFNEFILQCRENGYLQQLESEWSAKYNTPASQTQTAFK